MTTAKTAATPTKKIGLIAALAFAVGTMIGGGVFALSGTVVDDAGSGAIVGYILSGIVMLFSALCFAAVAARAEPGQTGYAPIATYLSPVWRFIAMWAFYIMGVAAIAFVLVSFGSYLMYFFPADMKSTALWWALGAAVLLVLLNFGPADIVGKAETWMVGFKVLVLLIMIVFGLLAFSPERLVEAQGTMAAPGSMLYAAAILFTAYTGFNVVTNMASEIKNPQKTVPLAVMLSLGIVAIVYILVAVALVMSDVKDFGSAGLASAAEALGEPFGIGAFLGILVAIAACVSTLSGANANVLASADLFVAMAANRDIPAFLGKLTSKGRPVVSVGITGVITVILMVSGAFETIVVLSNVATVAAMVIVALTAFQMARKKWPGAGMKLPLGVTIPVLAILGALSNLFQYQWWQNVLGVVLVAAGLIFYVFKHRSRDKDVKLIKAHIAAGNTPLRRALTGAHARTITMADVEAAEKAAATATAAAGRAEDAAKAADAAARAAEETDKES
ncbi:APC family permease [Microbacterium koreense]|uniref:APC family permease n=1 Tax=Microbacterium koreense TaxID=323761 RepID=A0ABW2ZUA0_9MICO